MAESKCHHFGAPIFKTEMPKQPRTPQCPLFSFLGTVYIYSAPLSYYLSSFIPLLLLFWETCTVDKGPTMLKLTSHVVQA